MVGFAMWAQKQAGIDAHKRNSAEYIPQGNKVGKKKLG